MPSLNEHAVDETSASVAAAAGAPSQPQRPMSNLEQLRAAAVAIGLQTSGLGALRHQLAESRAAASAPADADAVASSDDDDEWSDDDENEGAADDAPLRHPSATTAANSYHGDGNERHWIQATTFAAYGLVLASGKHRPQVPQSTTLPAWVSEERWRARRDPESATSVKCFNGLIIHRATDAVVGYLAGHIVTRGPALWIDCDDHSSELCDMVETLLEIPTAQLRQGFKLGTMWGDAIDAGKLGHVHQLELEPAHRGKGALADIAEPFRRFCVDRSLAAVACEVSGLHEPVLGASANAPSVRGMLKLRDSYATMGFRQVGISDWMLMVPDRAHPCWDPSTHEKPEFPFREVAKTAGDRSMPALLKKCIAARHTSRRTSNEVQQDDACLVDACIALDAIKAHDAERLARPSIVTIDGESRKLCGAALLACLLEATVVWQTHKLARGVRDLHRALNDHVL